MNSLSSSMDPMAVSVHSVLCTPCTVNIMQSSWEVSLVSKGIIVACICKCLAYASES